MSKEECEQFIRDKAVEIWDKYQTYNPGGDYLTICITDKQVHFNNAYWEEEKKVNFNAFWEDKNEI